MFTNKQLKQLTEELEEVKNRNDNQIKSLMEIFGLCGLPNVFISRNEGFHPSYKLFQSYIDLNEDKLPVQSKDFNELLKYLGIELIDTPTIPAGKKIQKIKKRRVRK